MGKLGLVRVYLWASLGVASVMLGWPGCSLPDPEIIHFSPKNDCFGVEAMIIPRFLHLFFTSDGQFLKNGHRHMGERVFFESLTIFCVFF